MYSDSDKDLEQMKSGIEQRVTEQLNRHLRANPRTDRGKIIDLQIEDERKRLRRAVEKTDQYDLLRPLDDWLLYLAKQRKEGR